MSPIGRFLPARSLKLFCFEWLEWVKKQPPANLNVN